MRRLIEGKRLSRAYCTSCHIYPEPDLLPTSTWMMETLPAMGPFMGIYEHKGEYYNYPANPSQTRYLPPDYYPSEQMLSHDEWQKILDYYEYASPEILTPSHRDPQIVSDSLFFYSRIPEYETDTPPAVTMVKFDPDNRLIYVSDSYKNGLMVFDENMAHKNILEFSSPVTSIQFLENPEQCDRRNMLLTYIGHLYPSDAPYGSVARTGNSNILDQSDNISQRK